MTKEITKSMQKKWDRKTKRARHLIERDANVACSDSPTQNLVICNAGLVSGLTRESILDICIHYGSVANIIMIPGQSFCFIQYFDVESAEKAMVGMHGKLAIGQNENVVYLLYTTSVPEINIQEKFNTLPQGLKVIPNLVTELEEEELLACIKWDENSIKNGEMPVGTMKYRKVKHYGYEFQYDTNNVDRSKPLEEKIPKMCDVVWAKLNSLNEHVPHAVDQLTVNMYKPGQGIPPHIDTHSAFESPIYSLSLGSDVLMEFRNNKHHCSVLLPQRSLLIMDKEARYAWTHGITPRTMDTLQTENGLTVHKRGTRTSFTFRTVLKNGICICAYPEHCDSQKANKKSNQSSLIDQEMIDEVAAKLEATHVHSVYEQIASHFSDTRHKPWPNVQKFVEDVQIGGLLVDVGCGNGKYFKSNSYIAQLGCDMSENLAIVCNSRGFEVATCNCLQLPFRDNIADAVISIAVIHHLANEKRRLQAIQQIVRILKNDGSALIYVWAKNQAIQNKKSNYLKKNEESQTDKINENKFDHPTSTRNKIPELPVHENRTQFKYQDMLVPWKLKSSSKNIQDYVTVESDIHVQSETSNPEVFLRYYHVFEEGELEKLCSKVDGVVVEKSFYDQGNWCVILRKNL